MKKFNKFRYYRNYSNQNKEVQTIRMSEFIEKVPAQLPSQITSLYRTFENIKTFNNGKIKPRQDLSKWKVDQVINHINFSKSSELKPQNLSRFKN